MGERLMLVVDQPCILCEETIISQSIFKNEETGQERIESRGSTHLCGPLRRLIGERHPDLATRQKTVQDLHSEDARDRRGPVL